jgi:hypothetical protein
MWLNNLVGNRDCDVYYHRLGATLGSIELIMHSVQAVLLPVVKVAGA